MARFRSPRPFQCHARPKAKEWTRRKDGGRGTLSLSRDVPSSFAVSPRTCASSGARPWKGILVCLCMCVRVRAVGCKETLGPADAPPRPAPRWSGCRPALHFDGTRDPAQKRGERRSLTSWFLLPFSSLSLNKSSKQIDKQSYEPINKEELFAGRHQVASRMLTTPLFVRNTVFCTCPSFTSPLTSF